MARWILIGGTAVAALLGVALGAHHFSLPEDPRDPWFYARTLGVEARPTEMLASCSNKHFWSLDGSDFYVARFVKAVAPLTGHPLKAGYQERHALVSWREATEDDLILLALPLRSAALSLMSSCTQSELDLLWGLPEKMKEPGVLVAYSHLSNPDGVHVLAAYVLEPAAHVFYTLRLSSRGHG